ncbi:MAG: NYN domain-containing protein [Planctomycetaceae bacterium]|nr:NYN domain-containing protein [Planctomycetaceae bacterium]
MFPGDILIDGYNVLHAAGFAQQSYRRGEFEKRRNKLLRLISQQLSTRERLRTTIVFDATDPSVMPSAPHVREDILVIFAGEGGDADATIERLIRENSAPRRLCVVSSDHRLQKAARRRRGRFIDSDVFLQRLARRPTPEERSQQQVEPTAKHTGNLPPGEVEAWLRVFEDIDRSESPPRRGRRELKSNSADMTRPGRGHQAIPSAEDSPSADDLTSEIGFWESRVSELWDADPTADD